MLYRVGENVDVIISFLMSWDEMKCVVIHFTTVFHYFYSWYLLKTVKESLLLSHVSYFIGVCYVVYVFRFLYM